MLLPALAVLQYRWVGQVSDAERERMHTNLGIAATQFSEAFDGEVIRAALGLQAGPGLDATPLTAGRYAERYDGWLGTAFYPQLVAGIFVVDADGETLRLRQWNPEARVFEAAEWPARLSALRPELERARRQRREPRMPGRGFPMRIDGSVIVLPFRTAGPPRGFAPNQVLTPPPAFGFTVIELAIDYIRQEMLPALTRRHFTHSDGDSYRVSVISTTTPATVLFQSDPAAPTDPALADASTPLLRRPDPGFFFLRRGARGGDGPRSRFDLGRPTDRDAPRRLLDGREDSETGLWRLLVQHHSGSLEAAVGAVRRRNLAISFGVLLLLTGSIGLLTVNTRKAQRLAQQQVEFVAGVSHELRTPVAVIRAAAENLEHGLVGGERVKQYGTAIGLEARRLGDMVERVLQYSGIQSGLGLGARELVSAVALIDAALASAMPQTTRDGIVLRRDVPNDIPAVRGDGPALRSAVENLVGNAIKYGGPDRFVGVAAVHVRTPGRAEVRITVSDHGNGIPAAELPHIFDPFYRGTDAAARRVHGNGLGLSLVKRIVEAHGGRVVVDTRLGAGSAFTLILPAASVDERASGVPGSVHPAHS